MSNSIEELDAKFFARHEQEQKAKHEREAHQAELARQKLARDAELDRTPEHQCVDCFKLWSEYDIYGGDWGQSEDEEPVCPGCAGRLRIINLEDE